LPAAYCRGSLLVAVANRRDGEATGTCGWLGSDGRYAGSVQTG